MPTTRYCLRCLTTFQAEPERCPNLSCGDPAPDEGWSVLLGAGDLLDRHYRIHRPLAVGGAGLTYLAREVDADGNEQPPDLAIKVLYAQRATGPYLRRLSNEAQILQELDHDNIVQCRGFVHRAGAEPYLVTLFEHGGSLAQHLARTGPLSPRVSAGILRQILLALDVAHQRGVVHRDLKPDNVLLGEPVDADVIPAVRVADFGIAKVAGGLSSKLTKLGSFVGTPEYAAPEQFEGMAPTAATDVFAAAGLLWFTLNGAPPFTFTRRGDVESSYEEMREQLPPLLQARRPDLDAHEARILQEVFDHCMAERPDDRWTVQRVLSSLQVLLGVRRSTEGTLEITDQGAPLRASLPQPDTGPVPGAASSTFSIDEATAEEVARHLATEETPETQETPAPPPPPPPQQGPPAAPPAAAREQSVAGWWGLGAAGVGVLGLAGTGAVLCTLVVAAWSLGWFAPRGAVAELAPVHLATRLEAALAQAPTLLGGSDAQRAARADLQRAVGAEAAAIGSRCGASGVVVATLLVDERGHVGVAPVDEGYLPSSERRCVSQALTELELPEVLPRAHAVRVAFLLPER